MEREHEILSFTQEVPAATSLTKQRSVSMAGAVEAVRVHFPSGTQGLVEVSVLLHKQGSVGAYPIAPSELDDGIALAGGDAVFDGLDIEVNPGDVLEAEWRNYDGGFAHTVPVEITVFPRD